MTHVHTPPPVRPDYYCTEHGKQLRWNGSGWECVFCEGKAALADSDARNDREYGYTQLSDRPDA